MPNTVKKNVYLKLSVFNCLTPVKKNVYLMLSVFNCLTPVKKNDKANKLRFKVFSISNKIFDKK